MQIRDENPVEESSTISHKENDLYDDADGEADDDDDVERYSSWTEENKNVKWNHNVN